MSTSPVLRRFPLASVWPTLDPFLFCVHHVDDYPAGNGRLGPRACLEGRSIGSDFGGKDGWSMYHGEDVPGFPGHPHRGFETVTVMRRGLVDHADSLGAAARFGHGDVQWLTAGRGIVHSGMFPLLREDQGNPAELFQIWLNLPAASKMAEPAFTMFWSDRVPELAARDGARRSTVVRVIAGALEGAASGSSSTSARSLPGASRRGRQRLASRQADRAGGSFAAAGPPPPSGRTATSRAAAGGASAAPDARAAGVPPAGGTARRPGDPAPAGGTCGAVFPAGG